MASFNVRQGKVQSFRSRGKPLFPKDFSLEDPGPLPHGQMEINGIRFPVDPQGISIHEENQNHAYQTLRNRESTKVRSGHGRINISVRAIFTGVSVGLKTDNNAGNSLATINDTLMPILYSLKKMPLCFIDNELIRRNLPIVSGEDENGNLVGENIGAFIKMVNIGTVPGMPHSISAEFQFVWYNHRPFTPRIIFRKDWVDDAKAIETLAGEYEKSNKRLSSRPSQKATQGTQSTPAQGTDVAGNHPGRLAFIQNFGHPNIAFNATAYHSYTNDIHQARPLLEYLWPYRYESSNPAVTGNQQVFDISQMPPFELESFERSFGLGFTVMRQPDTKVMEYLADQLALNTTAREKKKLARAKRTGGTAFGTLKNAGKRGAMSKSEVAAYAAQLNVHPDVLLAAIILWTENGLKETRSEQRLIVHSIFNNALRKDVEVWDYAVGARKLTGIQGRGKEFRRYGSSRIPDGKDLERCIAVVKSVLKERATDGNTFNNVTNFLHTATQDSAYEKYLRRLGDWKAAHLIWQATGVGEEPKKPKAVSSAAQVDKRWQENLNRITVQDISEERLMAYGVRSRRLGKANVKDHAEARLRSTPPQRKVGVADVTKIDINDALDIVGSSLGVFGAPHGPAGVSAGLVRKAIETNQGVQGRAEIQALLDLAQDGWTLLINNVTDKPVLVNDVSIDIPENSSSVIPTSINVGFGTNLAMMPLDGHRFPTIQYLGGQHTSATVTFRCEGEDGRNFVSELKGYVNSDEESAIFFREFSKRKGIAIENPMLNSLGMKVAFLESISVDTIPGNPEGLNVTVRLIDATLNEQLPPLLVGKDEVDIEDILDEALKLILDKGWIKFTTSGNADIVYATTVGAAARSLGVGGIARNPDEVTYLPISTRRDASSVRGVREVQAISNYINKYGAGSLQENINEVKRLTNASLTNDQGTLAKEGSLIYQQQELQILASLSRLPEGSKLRQTAEIMLTLRSDNRFVVNKGAFLSAGATQVEMTKKGWASGASKDILRLVDYLRSRVGERNRNGMVIPLSELLERVGDFDTNREKPLSEYTGFNNAKIDSSLPVSAVVAGSLIGTSSDKGLVHTPGFRALLTNITSRLIARLGVADNGQQPIDPDFAVLASKMGDMLEFNPGHVAYPDLMLPPNPITGLVADMTPDFFLVNESDVKMSNSNLAKIIFGEDTKDLPKKRGARIAKFAIQNGIQGIKDVYGASDNPFNGEGLRPAHEGKDGIYSGTEHETFFNVKGGKFAPNRSRPDLQGGLISIDGESPVIVETDINSRNTKSQSSLTGTKKYNRNTALGFHLQNNKHREQYTGAEPKNLNKVTHQFEGKEYERIFDEFETHYTSEHYAVRRSFPTFKVLFVEENNDVSSSENPLITKLTKTYALDDFYGVNSIKEIRIVKNKEMAADVCVIQVLDIDGVLYNRKYLPEGSSFGLRKTKGQEERNPFLDTVIKEGMKVVVKFGYSNDPTSLDTMFVGQIVNWEGSHLIEIVCQSYGTELMSQRFGTDPSENADLWNVTTSDLLHDLLDREEVRHFGRWKLADVDITGALLGVEKLRPDGKVKKVWTWKPSVVDDNLYIPDVNTYASGWAQAWGDLEYVFFDTTIWDCFKEMELRHPGYVAYPVPYGNGSDARMTMFFGHPSMIYLSRPAQDSEEIESEVVGNNINTVRMRELIQDVGRKALTLGGSDKEQFAAGLGLLAYKKENGGFKDLARITSIDVEDLKLASNGARARLNKLRGLLTEEQRKRYDMDGVDTASATYTPRRNKVFDSVPTDKFWAATQYFQDGRLRAFRNYELVTSIHDIISNNIRADHRDTFNSVELRYSDNNVNLADYSQGSGVDTITVNADDNIKDHHIRRTIENWPNCTTTDLARRYASQLLANSLKGTYKGELLILGRPQLKPYDIIWLYDNYSDMAGPIEVQEVVHTISSETGFITEVVPHMIVTVKEEVTTLMVDAIGAFYTEHLKDFTNGALIGLGSLGLIGAAGKIVGAGLRTEIIAGEELLVGESVVAGGLKVGAGLATGVGGALLPTGTIARGVSKGNNDKAAGVGVGLATGLLTAANPLFALVPCAAGILAGGLVYKLLKYNSTREPILITPLIKQGKPYVTGLEGMESDGLIVTDLLGGDKSDKAFENFIGRKWRYFVDGIDDAVDLLEVGWANWMAQP